MFMAAIVCIVRDDGVVSAREAEALIYCQQPMLPSDRTVIPPLISTAAFDLMSVGLFRS
jgi:hypothetical protein